MLTREQALQHVREHSGSAYFWDTDGHRWKVESVRPEPALRSYPAEAYEERVAADGLLTLRFTRETPTPLESAAERVAESIVSNTLIGAKAPRRIREQGLEHKYIRSFARQIIALLNP